METILIILLIYLIFRDVFKEDIDNFRYRKERKRDEKEEKRREEFKDEFDKMMSYSVERAIESKRGGETDGK
jgi:hypothetical protein